MWIYTDKGSLSIVADKFEPEMLWVRARSIAPLLPLVEIWDDKRQGAQKLTITKNDRADYLYRFKVTKSVFLRIFAGYILPLEYINFKDHVGQANPKLVNTYYKVYSDSLSLEELDEGIGTVELVKT